MRIHAEDGRLASAPAYLTTNNQKIMNDIQTNNGQGITVKLARILKSSVDHTNYQSPEQRFQERTIITNNISDPIDREEESWCDFVDLLSESAKRGIHQAANFAREQRAKAVQENLVQELTKKIEPFGARKPEN